MRKLIVTALALLFLSGVMLSAANAQERIYVHPIAYKTEDIPIEERDYIFEIMHEEMLAYQWLEVLTIDDMGASAATLLKCSDASCILPQIKKAGIPRAVFVSLERLKRRSYKLSAKTVMAGGQTQYSFSITENGSASDVRYIIPTVIENLFKSEFAKHGNSMAIAMNEEDTVTSTGADQNIARADELMENGETDQALKLYEEAAEMSPDLSLPHRRTAEARLEEGDLAGAMEAIDSALKKDSSDARSHYVKGRIAYAKGDKAAATRSLEQAINLDAKLTEAYFTAAQVADESGHTDKAIKLFEAVKVIQQDDPVVYVNLGKLYLKAKKPQDGRDALLRAMNLDEAEASLYPPLAESYEALNDWYNAAAIYSKLTDMLPDCAACHYNHGRALDQCGKAGDAIAAYEKAVEADPSFVDAWYNMGIDYNEIGKQDEARASLQKYVDLENRPGQAAFVKKARSLIESK